MYVPIANYIVLADDDRDHAVLFERALKEVHPAAKLSIVNNGEDLLNLLKKVQPELLFLDLHMPCKNGLECLQEIRSRSEFSNMRIVVYSSSAQMTDIQKCYLHKADLYMVKPFTRQYLREALQTVLNKESWQAATLENHYYINNRFVPFTARA
jgi:CheY-like chemotaxis protein